MPFDPADLRALERTEEVRIETRGADGTVHRTIIWVVVDGGDVFVRSVRGPSGRWYREACADPAVALIVDGRRIAARATLADDAGSVSTASDRFARKYARDPAVRSMLTAAVLPTTLRLDPTDDA